MTEKPFKLNLAEVPWERFSRGRFGSEDQIVSTRMPAQRLDYCVTRLAPGEVSCPYHFHHVDEELFLILEGTGRLRYDGQEVAVGAQDVIVCPPGPGSAHQLVNDGEAPLVYWAISIVDPIDICEYPDSDKLLTYVQHGADAERKVFRRGDAVDYWMGEAEEAR